MAEISFSYFRPLANCLSHLQHQQTTINNQPWQMNINMQKQQYWNWQLNICYYSASSFEHCGPLLVQAVGFKLEKISNKTVVSARLCPQQVKCSCGREEENVILFFLLLLQHFWHRNETWCLDSEPQIGKSQGDVAKESMHEGVFGREAFGRIVV